MNEPQSLKSCYLDAESKRRNLESLWPATGNDFQEAVAETLMAYSTCLRLVDMLSLFSPNETLEDVASSDLQYLILHFQSAQLILRLINTTRSNILQSARAEFEHYLELLNTYGLLSSEESRTYEQYQKNPSVFSTASVTDAAARRATKIAKFKEEKELKRKLEMLRRSPGLLKNDDASLRELHLTNISLCTHETFQALETIAQEMHILSLASSTPGKASKAPDSRERIAATIPYSDRLDPPLSQLMDKTGPILSKDGKPLRPFTLLDTRQRLHEGVFRPDYSLPTMSIDEYLEEEKRRGGIIEGGGPKSGLRPEPEEDNFEKADAETVKARAWDDFKDDNPRGAGNTMNMG